MPDSVYDSLQVPSLANVDLRKIKQFYTYDKENLDDMVESNNKKCMENLKHLQMQMDHLEGKVF